MTDNNKTPGQLLFEQLAINLDEVPFKKLVHYTAIKYFLTVEDDPPSDTTNLAKINRYLESFHHLCEVEDWERASKVILVRLNTPTKEELHEQLGTWGYFREQIEIYSQILDKLNQNLNFVFLVGFGKAHQSLTNYQEAINFFQQGLTIAEDLNDDEKKAIALSNLGGVYGSLGGAYGSLRSAAYGKLGQSKKAIEYSQQSLEIARNINNRTIEARALGNLGNIYGAIKRQYKPAITYLKKCLAIARDINNPIIEAKALDNLGVAYACLKDYKIAIDYFQQSLKLAQKIENRVNEAIVLGNLGELYRLNKEYNKAIKYHEESLEIAKQIGDRQIQTIALGNFGAVYGNLKKYEVAIDYFQKSLALAKDIGVCQDKFLALINLCIAYPLYYISKIFK